MKKIIAILLALAVVSMAFAQTFSMENTVEARPVIKINDFAVAGTTIGGQWSWEAQRAAGVLLRDTMKATGETGDGRGKFQAAVNTDLKVVDPTGAGLLNILPRIGIVAPAADHVAGSYKATDFLAFGFGTGHLTYAVGGYLGGAYDMPGPDGGRENASAFDHKWAWNSSNFWNGAFVTFLGDGVGVDGLRASLRFADDWLNKNTFSIGALVYYGTDLFKVSVKYDGEFGLGWDNVGADSDHNPNTANDSLNAVATTLLGWGGKPGLVMGAAAGKSVNTHDFAVGFAFDGLKDLAVGIKLGAAFDANFGKYSIAYNGLNYQNSWNRFGLGVGADFDFRNGITNKVWGRVGFGNEYDAATNSVKTAKVLPFGIGDELTYAIGGDYNAKFIFEIAYMQNGLNEKLKDAADKAGGVQVNSQANTADIYVYPSFSFTIGKNDFLFGVKNDIMGHIGYVPKDKDGNDWAHTKVYGDCARVEIPIKWTYHF